ncbi:MAG: AAA family ATPase [Planctomycetes bacterium]|nr:AAA family ATPase [Planctomycetota bacterium]
MYEESFGFETRPFAAAPRVDHYFPAESIDAARRTLSRCVERSEGVGLLIGPTGTGKSLLCEMLAEQFKNSHSVALLSSGRICTRRALLQAVLFELGLPFRGLEEGELRLSINDFVDPAKTQSQTKGVLLIVDEAHTLPLRLLEELRVLANLVYRGESRVQLILVGGAALEDRFTSPKLEALAQRVVGRCYLTTFTAEETRRYVRQEVSLATERQFEQQIEQQDVATEPIFTSDALRSIHRATDGIARLINQLCDHALILAHADGVRPIDAEGIERAWADLQQLPLPVSTPADEESATSSIIEFGGLDDEPVASVLPSESAAPPDPLDQIDVIQQQLDSVEAEFRPAGTIGPEVELVFPEHGDPFEERFDDEQVVLDRHLPLSYRQRVFSQNSQELSAALAQFVERLSDGQLAVLPMPGNTTGDATSTAEEAGENRLKPATDPVLPEAEETSPRPNDEKEPEMAVVGAESDDESDVLVIEEEVENVVSAETYRVAPVTRQEYRQLFAKLRRG